ncbi:uncharacterized protein N0V89_012445 [Didymosphaeria variabile]|uniref:Diphthine--ammonia ligase n=1 Tax=Didymosphaeria variabile TaxID=1932322 RepID=A0A9W9C5F4_9PLEO|nr:uncharacterized protein N0V89_012445 [Didymosphaeria variabile]KAJ4344701.1 hypothetical protein N0V89_012445 [Didymosphaeria variabile]
MASSLNVIALISGGKDSFFSILHCLANGHRLVALANLHPPEGGDEDINSFMYQTVGSSLVSLYGQVLDVPLYRQEIRGSAVIHDRDYREQQDDETEDLVPLLEDVMQHHPEANAVSTGAILSTYQRTRVENVALRLGLTPLSFLWQYPFLPPYLQSSLLTDMHVVGQNSKIIKVASGGLDESFLGENVADPRTVSRMKKALGRFSENGDGALVGEGGEFETLVVDGPSLLWKKRLEVQGEGEVVRQEGGTATWKAAMKVVEKATDTFSLQDLRKPPTFDDEFGLLLKSRLQIPSATSLPERQSTPITLPTSRHFQHGRTVILSNITGKTHPDSSQADASQSNIRLQLSNILFRLTKLLESYQTTANRITHCTLLLRDMKDFSSINSLYAKFFEFTNPPSRVTVAVGDTLPAGLDVMLTAIAHPSDQPRSRTGLHVQSQSYWAPANIGPYSQAISVPLGEGREVHIAGQIPLDPASMTLYTGHGFKGEALLSLQHLFRIGRTQNVKWWTAGVAMIPANADARAQEERVVVAKAVWKAAHEPPSDAENEDEEEVVDAWDRKNFSKAFDDTVARSPIPDYAVFEQQAQSGAKLRASPCVVIEVDALPRYASIEWACTGLNVDALEQFRDDESPVKESVVRHLEKSFEYRVVEIPDEEVDAAQLLSQMEYGTLYASDKFDWTDSRWFKRGIAWVPCKRVWGEEGREVRGVIVGGR